MKKIKAKAKVKTKTKVKKKETPSPIGRPSKYTTKLMDKAKDYLKNWEKLGRQVPSNCSLCVYLGITRQTVQDWKKDPKKPEFSYILEQISTIQEEVLIDKGLAGEFNSNICKLMMAKQGYSDKQELTGADGQQFKTNITLEYISPDVEQK